MPFPDVLERGEDFFQNYPRRTRFWKIISYTTSVFIIGVSKIITRMFYDVQVNDFHKLTDALERSKTEKRGLMTIMNHMSTVDDPFVWGTFPMSLYSSLRNIRWCLGAQNICFANEFLGTFFSLGGVLSTERFGRGPFQGSVDAGIKILSKENCPDGYSSWVHVYPEGFVLQLHPPHSNSMRYFKWGITRMILEASKPPIIVPVFGTGFEKISTEDDDIPLWKSIWQNRGNKVDVTIGDPIDEKKIDQFRKEWEILVSKYSAPTDTDLNNELKYGKEAQDLRSRVAAELRSNVANIRHEHRKFPQEDPRFKSPTWWKVFTKTEGSSDPDIKFIGQNWAIKRLHKFLNIQTNETNGSDNINVERENEKIKEINERKKKSN